MHSQTPFTSHFNFHGQTVMKLGKNQNIINGSGEQIGVTKIRLNKICFYSAVNPSLLGGGGEGGGQIPGLPVRKSNFT